MEKEKELIKSLLEVRRVAAINNLIVNEITVPVTWLTKKEREENLSFRRLIPEKLIGIKLK